VALVRKGTTPVLVAANKANARKSTGPRTELGRSHSRRNAVKHSVFANVSRISMMVLGEDPANYKKLRECLRRVFQPQDGFEQMLVEDMAEIRWRRRRVIRAEVGILVVKNLQFEEQQERYVDARERRRVGLSGLTPSISNFCQIIRCLKALKDSIESEGFNEGNLTYLNIVYGDECAGHGRDLLDLFKRGCQEAREAKDGTATAAEEAEKTREYFLQLLEKKISSVDVRIQILIAREINEFNPYGDSRLLPSQEDLDKIARYETSLERQFERKLQQLVAWRRAKGEVG
jgi:hypothetical protein